MAAIFIANLIGSGVATLVIARSENAFDDEKRRMAEAKGDTVDAV